MIDFIPSIKIKFYFAGYEFDLDQVTSRLGIVPDVARTRDDWPTKHYVETIWAIEIEEYNCIAISLLFEKLLAIIKSKGAIIRDICSDCDAEVGFVIVAHYQDGSKPELTLTREIISFAASINAEIGFDIYCYE